jgi:acyl dehydratase
MASNGLTLGSCADTERSIGEVVAELTGPDEVNRADIRRRLEVLAWDCPLHYDDAVARDHGYRGAIAPATMLMTWVMPPYWSPGDPAPTLEDPPLFPSLGLCRVPAPGPAGFVTSCATEYFEPVYPADRITATSIPTDVTPKTLAVGDGAFISVTTTYTKQTGEIVGIERTVIFRYAPVQETL